MGFQQWPVSFPAIAGVITRNNAWITGAVGDKHQQRRQTPCPFEDTAETQMNQPNRYILSIID